MSEVDRNESPQYRGLIISLIAATIGCAVVLLLYGKVHRDERRDAAVTAKYERFTECITASKASAAQCKSQAEQSRYDQSAEAYDLKAQQEMARWAALMLVATSVGVFFVAATFRQAAEANKAAQDAVNVTREMGQAQIRAYLVIDRPEFFPRYGTEGNLVEVDIKLTISNQGQTPASVQFADCRFSNYPPQITDAEIAEIRARSGVRVQIGSNTPQSLTKCTIPLDRVVASKGKKIIVVYFIQYLDVFDRVQTLIHAFSYRFTLSADQNQVDHFEWQTMNDFGSAT